MLVIVPIIVDEAVGYCSHYIRLGCWLLFPLFNSNQQPDPKQNGNRNEQPDPK
jgi:hypothetical protein